MKRKLSIGGLLLAALSICAAAPGAEPIARNEIAEFEGMQLHYKTFGSGSQALVFVHGWTCNSNFWRESIAAFPGYRTIALDLPGHGQSDKPRTNYTMDYFARAVAVVLRDAKVKQAVLVGHSMGTLVIRQFYRLYP
jgi:pimeloyl-ACP methyl ester carboxylesterase